MADFKKYRISLIGCHDNTDFEVDLTDEQLEVVKFIAKKSEEVSEFSCMPVMEVEELGGVNNG